MENKIRYKYVKILTALSKFHWMLLVNVHMDMSIAVRCSISIEYKISRVIFPLNPV